MTNYGEPATVTDQEKDVFAEVLEADPRSNGSQIGDQTGKDCELNEEDAMRSQSPESASEKIKIQCGNLELPVSPEVLDDLLERSNRGEGEMEVLLSKYVMGELAKAIKRKTSAMIDSSKLETEFAKQLEDELKENEKLKKEQNTNESVKENKVEELRNRKTSMDSKAGKFEEAPIAPGTNTEGRQKNLQQQGVMKPAEERDYYVREEKKEEAPAAGAKPNYLDNNPIDRIINAEDHGNVGEEKKREEPKAAGKGTAPVCENATLNRNVGMGANRGQGVGEGKGKNVQGGRGVQGNQWGKFWGGSEKADHDPGDSETDVGRGKRKRKAKEKRDELEEVEEGQLLFTLRLGQQLGRQHYTEHTCSSRSKVQSSRLCRRNQETMRAQAEFRGAAAG
nr:hypothetical protein Iba_chr05fCG17180 [Ipomoea batatas]